jgi:hypothetical protein
MTNTESNTITKTPWWIKYQTDNGKVIGLSSNELKSTNTKHGVTTTYNELCRELISGTVSFKACSIVWDVENEIWDIDLKQDVLDITQSNTNFLYQIKEKPATKSDVLVRVYKKEHIVEITVNIENIKKSMNLTAINEIANKENTLLNLYFTKKNDPDYLIQSVEVDPLLLFRRKTAQFNLPLDWDNVSLFTKQIFKNYSLEIFERYIPTMSVGNKNTLLQHSVTSDKDSHLCITASGNTINIHSNIDAKQGYLLDTHKFTETMLQFLVCDELIDNFVGAFEVPAYDLINEDDIIIDVDFDIPLKPLFIFKNKHIAVNFTGDSND